MIPDNVTTIGSYAFSGCVGLQLAIVPAHVDIGEEAFLWSGNDNLVSFLFKGYPGRVEKYAFPGYEGGRCIGYYLPDTWPTNQTPRWTYNSFDSYYCSIPMAKFDLALSMPEAWPRAGGAKLSWSTPIPWLDKRASVDLRRKQNGENLLFSKISSDNQSGSFTDSGFYDIEPCVSSLVYRASATFFPDGFAEEGSFGVESEPLEARRRFGIFVGTGEYAPGMDWATPHLLHGRDAATWNRLARDYGGFENGKRVCLNGDDAKVGRVRDAILDFAEQARPGDLVLLAISTQADGLENRLALYDGDLSNGELRKLLKRFDPGVVVVVVVNASQDGKPEPGNPSRAHWKWTPGFRSDNIGWVVASGMDDGVVDQFINSFFITILLDAGWEHGFAGDNDHSISMLDLARYAKRLRDSLSFGLPSAPVFIENETVLSRLRFNRVVDKPVGAPPGAVSKFRASRGVYVDSVALSWEPVDDAEFYVPYRSTGFMTGHVPVTLFATGTSFFDKDADSSGSPHGYMLRAWNWHGVGPFHDQMLHWAVIGSKSKSSDLSVVGLSDVSLRTGDLFQFVLEASGGVPPYVWTVNGLPEGITNAIDGTLAGMAMEAGVFTNRVVVSDANGATASGSFEMTVSEGDLRILSRTLRNAFENRFYQERVVSVGGSAPYAWSISPFWTNAVDGLSIDDDGWISGWIPEGSSGTIPLAISVEDSKGHRDSCQIELTIDVPSLNISNDPVLPIAVPGCWYWHRLEATGGVEPYTWEIVDPDNCPGWIDSDSAYLTFHEAIQSIREPTDDDIGSFSFTLRVTDATGAFCEKRLDLSIGHPLVSQPPSLDIPTPGILRPAFHDEEYWYPVKATGGTEPYSWEIVDEDAWPEWLNSSYASGWNCENCGHPYVTGTPSDDDLGTYSFALRVTDAEGSNVVKQFTLEVRENPDHRPVIESRTPNESRIRVDPGAMVGFSLSASDEDGDVLSYSWELEDEDCRWISSGDSETNGWFFDTSSYPEGVYYVQASVFDGSLRSYQWWTVNVSEKTPLAIATDAALPVALTDDSYWQPVVATGGEEPYTWEIVNTDDWPAWLRTDYFDYWDDWGYDNPYLSSDWHPSEDDIGMYSFSLRVTDAEGSNVVKTFTLEVQENPNPPPVIDSSSPDNYYVHIEPGQSQTFSVEAHDPKGDPLSFYWYVYDSDGNRLYRSESGGDTNEFSWTFDAAVTGTYEVTVEVADGHHSRYRYWGVVASIPKTIYVDQASTATDPDGTSWATAYPTLGDAQGDIEEGDTVLVAPGAYSCPYLPEDIELRSRDGAAATSITGILSGGGLTVVGFTFEGIRYSYPAPMPYPIVSPGSKLVGCVIRGCSSDGGLLNDCELEDCIVSDCESARDLIDGCDLANCAVVGNTSGYDILSGCRLWNCTVAGNTLLSWYDALDQSCSAWNSILWGNYNVEELEYEWPWPSSVDYGFWWDDATGDYTDLHMTELHDCCVEGIWDIARTLQNEYGLDYDPDALGLIEMPPAFVDLAHGDVRLRTGSPCVNAGSNAWVHGTTDAAGNPRIQGVAVDLGAFEGAVDGFVLSVRVVGAGTVSPATVVVPAGGSATFTASESAGRPFVGWATNGVAAGNTSTLALANVQTDGTVVATFGSFSFCVDAATGDDANDGLSWAAPKATIQAAVEAAVDGEGVLVKPGVYGPVDTAGKAVRIESTDGKAATVLDGGGTNRCAYLGTGVGHGATLAGFALRNGNAAWDASPKAGMGGGAHGGTLLDCDITGCSAYEKGGGLACSEAHRCAIVGNGIFDGDDWAYGGGAYESDLYSCLVASNAIVLSISPDDPTPAAKAYGGGAAWGSLYQCTVADNSIQSDDLATGGGWYADWGELNGSIFYGNTANGAASDVENWEGSVSFEQSLVGVDPLFVDRANGDYRLRQDSPAVDAGFSSTYEWRGPPSESIADLDLDGNPRVRGLCIDLGCYESGYTATDKATSTTPEPVPYAWLNENATNAVKGAWGGYEAAAKATAANGRPVWECYVADLDPEDEDDDLVADIEMADGRPVVTILKGEKASRDYETQGAPAPGGPWGSPDANSRFFRVKVSLP